MARLETGHTPSRKKPEYWGGDIPWIGIKDVTPNHGRVLEDTLEHTNELGIANSSARVLPANTVCLSRTASVGHVVVMGRPMATSQDFVNWVCSDALDYRFLKYVLLAERTSFLRFASGTTHQTIYFPEVKAFHVCMPSVAEQRRIVAILGALDDKIELNRRMSETLEEMARALFKAWFVDYEPTRALVEGTSYSLPADLLNLFPREFHDDLPLGWRRRPVGEMTQNFDRLRVPLSAAERSSRKGRYRYYGAAGVIDHIDDHLFDGTYVLVGEDGSVVRTDGTAVTQYVWGKFWVNNHAHVLQGNGPLSTEHVYLYFLFEPVTPYVTGAVQAKLAQSRMNKMPFVDPGEAILTAFGDLVAPYFARLRSVSDETSTLSDLRDTLLPKLISGELRVPDAERLVSEVA